MAGCGCGGSGGFTTDGLVPADQQGPDESYFWTGEPPPSDETPPAEGAKAWSPDTGTEA